MRSGQKHRPDYKAGLKNRPGPVRDPDAAFNRLYKRYKWNARKVGRSFTLLVHEFEILTSSACHYCGALPSRVIKSVRGHSSYVANGIDRLDSKRGYETDNVVPCCLPCNWMKCEMTPAEFLEQVRRIWEHNRGKV